MKKVKVLLLALTVMFTMCFSGVSAYAASGIAITTADELKAMENDPSGSYYLANDIDLPANLTLFNESGKAFKGTFDGNGYKLNGYTYSSSAWVEYAALFKFADGASFKNINMTNVNMSLKGCGYAAALCAYTNGGSFSNIKISGKISSDKPGNIAGVVGYNSNGSCTLTNIKNSADIKITNADQSSSAAGIAVFLGSGGVLKKCSNSGDISVSGPADMDEGLTAAGVVKYAKTLTSCTNSGNITVTAEGGTSMTDVIAAAGIANTCDGKVTSCGNSGKIKVTSNVSSIEAVMAAGLVCEGTGLSLTKCWNKGSVSFSGKADRGGNIGGLAGSAGKLSQSYNKAAVSAKISSGKDGVNVGGLCGNACDIRNSYNTGAVTLSGNGYAGGLAGYAKPWDERIINNYTTGKIKASSGGVKGQVIGYYEGAEVTQVRNIYNNYYTKSGKAYGASFVTWKEWTAKAKKVSTVNSSNCPKLSSKYWKYSSKYGRMILKNNKEK